VTDIVDRAQEREAEMLADAQESRRLEAERAAALDAPLIVDGKHLCIDCSDEIPAGRLKAMPHAVRCCSCQVDEEYMKDHWGR